MRAQGQGQRQWASLDLYHSTWNGRAVHGYLPACPPACPPASYRHYHAAQPGPAPTPVDAGGLLTSIDITSEYEEQVALSYPLFD